VIAVAIASAPAAAQFSSDFPGVPRAGISIRGSRQNRTEWTLGGNKIPRASGGDTIAFGVRLGFGRSYRIRSQFEFGFDYTLIDGLFVQPPKTTGAPGASSKSSYIRGLLAYGFRVGGKYRVYSSLDPEGYGYQISVGAGYQPKLKPLFGVEHSKDSTRIGGQFSKEDSAAAPSTAFTQNPFASLRSSTMISAMGSYRSKRLRGDAALLQESVGNLPAGEDPSPTGVFDGLSLRLGGAFRVTRRIALGATYWGSGSPPWRDAVQMSVPGVPKAEKYAFLVQFGSELEGGTDLMLTSPTGKFSESVRLYIRIRSTK
jgi:hypothetical protein